MPSFGRVATVVALLSFLLCASNAQVQEDWPVEINIKVNGGSETIQRPVGVVAGLGTTIYVGTAGGQLYLADIKTGEGELINRGGDNQRFGGLCLDSRGPGTLYATGRDSGILYAFNRRGELLQQYQIVAPSSESAPIFLTGCIQAQYQLIIVDSLSPRLFYLRISDAGPSRGYPPPPDPQYEYQGYETKMEGDWNQTGSGFNAYGVEWTQKFKKAAYVMNSATGQLYTCTLTNEDVLGEMQAVNVKGKMSLFPGALHILFDSSNENVLYLTMPHINAIAVLEISGTNPGRAKYIRMLTSGLLEIPVAVSEYGNFIYPINAKLTATKTPTYTMVKISRHRQLLESGDPEEEFTTLLDDVEESPLPTKMLPSDVEDAMRAPPAPAGTAAPVAIGTTPPPTTDDSEPPTTSDSTSSDTSDPADPGPTDSTDSSSEAAPPEDSRPTVTPVSAPPDSSSSSDESDDDRPTSVFAVNDDNVEEDSGSACFPASATVRTEDERVIRMDELRLGDRILVGTDHDGRSKFSSVYLFSHQDRTIISNFIQIRTEAGHALELSEGHYIYVNGKLATAATVEIGDMLSHCGHDSTRVTQTQLVKRPGLYNPQTVSGDIVVNGIRTSTFTSAIEPAVASALLAPLRAMHFCSKSATRGITGLLGTGGNGMERFFPRGSRLYT